MSEADPQAQPEAGDWGYDEAHADVRRTQDARPHQHPAVQVVTETSDDGQDYSYDLAHDLPPARR